MTPSTDSEWQERAKNLLKGELKKRGVSYIDLADKLSKMGVIDNDRNIANKVSRGGFSAVFFLQCLAAIGCSTLRLGDD